ncbi:MAG TPA: DUF2092 domain-containing protein [Allosphingosinicella sp.]|jgi:hypothetical protein|nr:DUF2092 domain-containing protein [Allosphingosinicella sp.]
MKNKLPSALLSAAASALILGAGLSSCSAGKGGTPAGGGQNAAEQNTGEKGESDKNARALLKAMSDYLAAQQVISMSYDSVFEVVTNEHQKLQIATSGTVELSRPDKIRTTRKSGFSDTEMVYDGKTVSFLGKGQNAYMQTEAPGTIDTLIDQLRDKFHRQLPGADLLQSGVYDELMTGVTDVKDLGSGVIGGVECDHLAFRAKDTDWQIWIAQGAAPYPCRYVITSKGVDQAPQFTLEVRDWRAGGAARDFSFTPPPGARRMRAEDLQTLRDTSDLPENYRIGAAR